MGGGGSIQNAVYPERWYGFGEVFEQASPAGEQDGHQGYLELLDDIQVQVLLDDVRATRNANVLAGCGLPCLHERALGAVIHEVEGGAAGTDPGLAPLVRQHVHGSVKRSFLRPTALASLEHAFAHDVGTNALRRAPKHVVHRAGFSSGAELEVRAEILLIEDPRRQRAPLGTPVFVFGVVPMLEAHSFWRHVAVKT